MKKRGLEDLTALEMMEVVRRNPDFWVEGARIELRDTGNPYYAWMAVQVCIEHKKEFPDWLVRYLELCAERMLSDKAREGGDLRKVLPWILGFPQHKRGPGNMLDPEGRFDMMMFALKFAIRLERGEEPNEAASNAYNEVFDNSADGKTEEKTLRRWLLKEFDLKKWPTSADEWKNVTREHYRSVWDGLRCAIGQSLAKP
jgi:hypothetical protein